jgi:hypothetical protein
MNVSQRDLPNLDASPLAPEERAVSLDDVLRVETGESARLSPLSLPARALPTVIVGTLVGIGDDGAPLVDFDGNRTGRPLTARCTAAATAGDAGGEVALLFECGDLSKPIILGMIYRPEAHESRAKQRADQPAPRGSNTTCCGAAVSAAFPADGTPAPRDSLGTLTVEATADGKRVTLTADKEIELRCGKASITLTRAGKVLIRGAYLLSRSSGVNRIKGGSVQIN